MDREQICNIDLIEILPIGVLVYDESRTPIVANHVIRGLVQDKAILLPDFIASFTLSSQSTGSLSRAVEGVFTGKSSYYHEIMLGQHFFEAWVQPVNDKAGRPVGGVIILSDIARLKEADRMRAEIVSLVSHQIRTPLTSIRLFAEALLDEQGVGPLNKLQRSYLQDLSDSTIRLISLLNDLLDVSRADKDQTT
ncbi:MAG: histidine kinase dimerization/phospho-acceptor domain-containing protein [Candidatus Falkowbacteria bacterium]